MRVEFRLFHFDHNVEVAVFISEPGKPRVHCGEMAFTAEEWVAFHELVGYWPQDAVIVTDVSA